MEKYEINKIEEIKDVIKNGKSEIQIYSQLKDDLKMESYHNCFKVVKYLLEATKFKEEDLFQALKSASLGGHINIVKELIKNNANYQMNEGEVLVNACIEGHYEIAKYLLEIGTIIDNSPSGACFWAKTNKHTNIVKLIEEYTKKQVDKEVDKEANINLTEKDEPLNKLVENYENSLIKDTTLEEAKQLVEKDNLPTPKLQKQR